MTAAEAERCWIPRTHNYRGFPGGVAGLYFIGRLLEQARSYGVIPIAREIVHLALASETQQLDGVTTELHEAGITYHGRELNSACGRRRADEHPSTLRRVQLNSRTVLLDLIEATD